MGEETFVIKRSVRLAWLALLAAVVMATIDDPSPQLVVVSGMTAAAVVGSLRATVVLRDGILYRRGLLGWESRPLLLEEVARLSLRREASNRYFQRELRLIAPDGFETSLECWAWAHWRHLAHMAWHFARATGAQVDEASRNRLEELCPGDCNITVSAAAGRRAAIVRDERMTLRELLLGLPIAVAFGFALGTGSAWLRDDVEFKPEWELGLALGGVFAVTLVVMWLWEALRPRDELSDRP